jgi:DUF1680 family protein
MSKESRQNKQISRQDFLKAAIVAGAAAAVPTISTLKSQEPVHAASLFEPLGVSPQTVFPFPLGQVTLQNSTAPFTGNRDRTYSYLLFLNDDRMLYNFKVTAGLSTNGAQAPGGWDAPDVKLRGHSTGHYLKALSQAYASTGDGQYLNKINYLVTELGRCQDASPSRGFRTGYLAGYPEDQFAQLENLATYPTIWAPYYTCHKIMAGLLAAYQLAGNNQALTIVTRMADWVYGRLSPLPRTRLQQMWALYIAGEFGGMNETLAELYTITGTANHLTAATFFDNDNLFPAMSNNQDTLNGKHANQHIPQITGALRVYDQNNNAFYYNVAENFWNIVTSTHMYCIGGTGEGESWRAPNAIASLLTASTCETCATYNMLKLTRQLFFHNPDARYMDYYERGLYNHILASQNQASSHGFVTYFVPLNVGGTKTFSNDYSSFTCCHGTGMENHTKYQDTIYAFSGETLYVNLFVPSTLNWASRGITITQSTSYPESNTTQLNISGAGHIALKVRVPGWVQSGWQITVNGALQNVPATPGTYATIDRNWANGDVVVITIPMAISFEPTPDNANVKAVKYGGMVLCSAWTNSSMPSLNQGSVTPTTTPLQFNGTVNGSTPVTLIPFYKKFSGAYTVYFNATGSTATNTPTATNTATNTPGTPGTPTVTPTVTNTPLPGTGPSVWYKFDGNANDSSGNARNATVTGGNYVAGRNGQAVNLSGSSQYVTLPTGVVSALNDFTIATWVKLDTTGSWRRIFDFGSSTTVNMFLTPSSGSVIRFAITTNGSGSEQRINGTAALPTATWKHVAVTLAGNTGRLYVDGVQVGQNTNMTLRPSSLGNTSRNWLGRSQYTSDAYLDGQLDQFYIYNRALSAAEVLALFQTP